MYIQMIWCPSEPVHNITKTKKIDLRLMHKSDIK